MKSLVMALIVFVVIIGCSDKKDSPSEASSETLRDHRVIEFWAPWCGPCKIQKPIIEQYEEKTGLKIERVNVDENADLAKQYEVTSIPTIIVIKGGVAIDKRVGIVPLDKLEKWLEAYTD